MKLSENLILPNRNVIINGDMSIYQRAESVSAIKSSGNYWTADRFSVYAVDSSASSGLVSLSMINDAPTDFSKAFRYQINSVKSSDPDSIHAIDQGIEGINCQRLGFGQPNKKMTLSFWCRSSKAGTFTLHFSFPIDNGLKALQRPVAINSANTWEKKVVTVPTDPSTTLPNDNLRRLSVFFMLDAGSNRRDQQTDWDINNGGVGFYNTLNLAETQGATFDLTGVQLEAGDVATPFEHLPYQENLNRCKRYYYEQTIHNLTAGYNSSGYAITSSFSHPVEMRSTPNFSQITLTNYNGAPVSLSQSQFYTLYVNELFHYVVLRWSTANHEGQIAQTTYNAKIGAEL